MENINYKYEGGFIAFILNQEYTAYRTADNNTLEKGSAVMSSIVPHGIATLFIHESELHLVDKFNNKEIESTEFKKNIIYGLCEQGHPPTLISPRPRGAEDRTTLDKVFSRVYFQEIFQAMFDQSIMLNVARECSIPNEADYYN